MANQAGPIDDLVHYKRDILSDNRRESHIRGSIEATLKYFSDRRAETVKSFDSRTVVSEDLDFNDQKRDPYVTNTAYPPEKSFPMDMPKYEPNGLGRDLGDRHLSNTHTDGHSNFDQESHFEKGGVENQKVSVRIRLKHFTFAWYAWTMATGGVAFTLSVIPYRFSGLTDLGIALFIVNIIFFTFNTTVMIARFIIHPGTFTHALTNVHEGFFFATFWLSIATMITNTTAYGIPNSGPWLIEALRIAFWIYTVCASLIAIFYYFLLFSTKQLVITNVLPGWLLPVFPAMLVGTLASAIAKTQPVEVAAPMLVAGLSFQGLGMILAISVYGIYFGRLMTAGLPADMSRPAMFIAVGPPAFTALALIGMAQDVVTTNIFPNYIALPGIQNQSMIPDLLQILALLSAIFLWVLSAWFFSIALVAMFEGIHRNEFHLNWYAKIFPNVGFTIATIKIGERLGSDAIQMVGTGMAFILFFGWVAVFFVHVKAVAQHKIAWPGKDEDAH